MKCPVEKGRTIDEDQGLLAGDGHGGMLLVEWSPYSNSQQRGPDSPFADLNSLMRATNNPLLAR